VLGGNMAGLQFSKTSEDIKRHERWRKSKRLLENGIKNVSPILGILEIHLFKKGIRQPQFDHAMLRRGND
jgi:hypothetical protein